MNTTRARIRRATRAGGQFQIAVRALTAAPAAGATARMSESPAVFGQLIGSEIGWMREAAKPRCLIAG